MESVRVCYRIVTPMFLGGSKPGHAEGLRPSAVKGALRFWWRAIQWGRFHRQCGGDGNRALAALHRAECRIFGSASRMKEGKAAGGQGIFLLSVSPRDGCNPQSAERLEDQFQFTSWHHYLLGQGLCAYDREIKRTKLTRNAIPNGTFTVTLCFRPLAPEEREATRKAEREADRRSVLEALWLFGVLGGLGSRVRRGWGSVALSAFPETTLDSGFILKTPTSAEEIKDGLAAILSGLPDQEPPFSAFCATTRISCSVQGGQGGSGPRGLLDKVGQELQLERAWGRNKKVNGRDAERNFEADHDLVVNLSHAITRHPKRVVYGLPHNYYISSVNKKVDFSAGGQGRSRRASPLLIHIHQFPDGACAALQTLMPAQFLPQGDQVVCTEVGRNRRKWDLPPDVDYGLIHRYLDRFTTGKELLP